MAINHSTGTDFKDFTKFYKKCTAETYYFLVNMTLPSNNILRFRKYLLK